MYKHFLTIMNSELYLYQLMFLTKFSSKHFFFFLASGCLFIEIKRKSMQGNCVYVFSCLPFLHLILAFMVRM